MPSAPPVSFRPTPELRLRLEQLRATFPSQRWGEVFQWLFEDPEVVTRIRERRDLLFGGVLDQLGEDGVSLDSAALGQPPEFVDQLVPDPERDHPTDG